jgi:hypothetical protein
MLQDIYSFSNCLGRDNTILNFFCKNSLRMRAFTASVAEFVDIWRPSTKGVQIPQDQQELKM